MGSTESINFALNANKNNPEVMAELIPLALNLCENCPTIAKMIDTRPLIPI